MARATVSQKGQVVIPASIRRRLGIVSGTRLDFESEGATIRVTVENAVPHAGVAEGYGLLQAPRSRAKRRLLEFDPALAMRRLGRR